MREFFINKAYIETGALGFALRAALPGVCYGISHNGRQVSVHLADDATLSQQAQAESIVQAHNPAIIEASRTGDAVSVTIWLPYGTDETSATLTIEGDPLPAATPLSADQRGGLSGSETLNSPDAVALGVIEFDCTEVTI